VLDLPRGRFLVGVGDAAGHGIPAASLMAELRNAARGLAVAGRSPHRILDDLAVLADGTSEEVFATALYGVLDPGTGALQWATAGHFPPMVIRSGNAQPLDVGADGRPPIASGLTPAGGLRRRRGRTRSIVMLEPGDTLVLFTDGVVERRTAALSAGLGQLLEALSAYAADDVDLLADRIVADLCADATDDCSLLLLRRRPESVT